MTAWLLACGLAQGQQVTLGMGRIAVVEPGSVPTELATSAAAVVEVFPSPPALLFVAKKAGTATVSVTSATGTLKYTVTVLADPAVPPSGNPGVSAPGEALDLPPNGAVVCHVPGANTFARLEQRYLQVHPFGTDRYFLQVEGTGRSDVAFERNNVVPMVLTVATVATGQRSLPKGCAAATEQITVAVGETTEVTMDRRVAALLVGHPDIVHVTPIEGTNRLTLSGLRPGQTTLAIRAREDEDPAMRTIVVAARP